MLTGDATNADPVCDKSPHHHIITEQVELAQQPQPPAAEVKQIILFRDDKNSRKLAARDSAESPPRDNTTPVS
jgi:pyrroloquinoline quinone biosynthesis protein E